MAIISVVIPVYKAEDCLHELYRRLSESLSKISADFEIVLVEDCGGDRSWEIIQELANKDQRIKGLQLSRNFGQHYAITAGMDHCNGDWVIVMDCDLQDRPEEIPKLYEKALTGYDIVLAQRIQRKDKFLKKTTSWLFYQIFSYLADIKYDATVGNFRIISRQVVDNFKSMREQLRFFGGLIDWMGYPTSKIEVQHDPRFAGETSYNFLKLCKLAINIIIAYSDKPLRLSIQFGFIIALGAFIYGLYILLRAMIYGTVVSGWASVIVSLYFLGGIIIANLGIIGIYLGKSFDEAKKRPLYLVRNYTESINRNEQHR